MALHRRRNFITRASALLFAEGLAAPVMAMESAREASLSALYQAAKKEGTVSIWSHNAEEMRWIPSAFSAAYPGMKVEVVTDLNVVARVVTEARAGRHQADVVWSSEALVRPLIERELLVEGGWSGFGARKENIGADGHMLITSSVAFSVAYRRDRVAASDVPRTWKELLDSKYRGKMAAGPILFARLCAALGAFEGEAPLLDFARKFRRDSQTLWTNDLLEQMIASGERPYVVAITDYLAEGWKNRGAPIEVVLPEPVYVTQFGSVVTRRAPHPNAARLLVLWLESPQGRKAMESALLAVDLRPSSDHPKAVALRNSGKRLYIDSRQAMDVRNRLIPEMDRIMSGLD